MNKTDFWLAGLCLMLMPLMGHAQSDDANQPQPEKKNIFNNVKKLAERSLVHGVDTNYIKMPDRPWQVSLTSRVAQTDLKMHSSIDGSDLFDGEGVMPDILGVGDMTTEPRFMTKVSTSMGVKVGYKGLSVGYSFPVGGDKGQSLSFKSTGSWYAVNLRWHSFKAKSAKVSITGQARVRDIIEDEEQLAEVESFDDLFTDWSEDLTPWNYSDKEELPSHVSIKTLIFDGFYIFNHKTFSYGAAYNQKTIQVRSAGSPIAGLMGYYSDFKYNNPRNAELVYLMDGIGRLRQYQLALGAGYAYNYVPAKGWLVSAMAMPMITLVNRTRINTYTTNYKEKESENFWMSVLSGEETEVDPNEYEMTGSGVHSNNNKVALNFTTRMGVTYNWKRYFISANGQFNNFHFSHSRTHGYLNDWYINAAVGVRL